MPTSRLESISMNLDVANLGQVFTPQHIVSDMLGLIKNTTKMKNPRFLEPSCGNGAFFKHLPQNKIAIELDSNVIADSNVLNTDFFSYPVSEKFDVIIGNPPYVRYQDIAESTKFLLSRYSDIFDSRSNLYLFFIYKCVLHLKEGGELIFITPRDFLKSTASMKLNEFLFSQGSITDFLDLGDKKIFESAQPNCAIWRFEKGNFSRNTNCLRQFSCINGQLLFTKNSYTIPFSSLFFVKVGAVSGADSLFVNEEFGNMDFVYSQSAKSGKTRKMIYGIYGRDLAFLQKHKEALLKRRIKKFDETNWWEWGRDYYKSDLPRIYVNAKTRNKKPFFLHSCKAYDGSILAIFPKFRVDSKNLENLCTRLNEVNWQELGFVCDGRYLFSQRSLESCVLDSSFGEWLTTPNML
ncbi:class I SAM-dependent methyltransferase [Helicobacter sp. 14348-15]|uniref:Eco57I restriction-modification methylase domain-containing protein n=1 Tax=Helicobacter colisuis TaxID=2949739 RepID=UPI00202B8116|nr:class I SAM-dependent methyltransferase [Helicobacter colisuis]MCL9820894.1 class I SAM-dependent methyltransferase [Helicobacter colisuis]